MKSDRRISNFVCLFINLQTVRSNNHDIIRVHVISQEQFSFRWHAGGPVDWWDGWCTSGYHIIWPHISTDRQHTFFKITAVRVSVRRQPISWKSISGGSYSAKDYKASYKASSRVKCVSDVVSANFVIRVKVIGRMRQLLLECLALVTVRCENVLILPYTRCEYPPLQVFKHTLSFTHSLYHIHTHII